MGYNLYIYIYTSQDNAYRFEKDQVLFFDVQ
jgi:hypothetical protein